MKRRDTTCSGHTQLIKGLCGVNMVLTFVSFAATGRAGLLGLAISLVSTVPERVWYVKAKGYKPWLNPKPQDVKHNDEGGHTIWYNEPDLLQVAPAWLCNLMGSTALC